MTTVAVYIVLAPSGVPHRNPDGSIPSWPTAAAAAAAFPAAQWYPTPVIAVLP